MQNYTYSANGAFISHEMPTGEVQYNCPMSPGHADRKDSVGADLLRIRKRICSGRIEFTGGLHAGTMGGLAGIRGGLTKSFIHKSQGLDACKLMAAYIGVSGGYLLRGSPCESGYHNHPRNAEHCSIVSAELICVWTWNLFNLTMIAEVIGLKSLRITNDSRSNSLEISTNNQW